MMLDSKLKKQHSSKASCEVNREGGKEIAVGLEEKKIIGQVEKYPCPQTFYERKT